MSAEWSQASLRSLIKIYKKNKNMYDPKHSLYYNKPSRNRGLEEIRIVRINNITVFSLTHLMSF